VHAHNFPWDEKAHVLEQGCCSKSVLDHGRLETVVVLWLNMGHRLQDLLEIGTLSMLGFSG
jgi:hypothetical protein